MTTFFIFVAVILGAMIIGSALVGSRAPQEPREDLDEFLRGTAADALGKRLPDKDVTEDKLLSIQSKFEKYLSQNYSPVAASNRQVYIYRNLMLPWFKALSSKHRYDLDKVQHIRKDWVDYLNAIEEGNTSKFLAMESYGDGNSEQHDEHDEDIQKAVNKSWAVEDAFAAYVGEDATDLLEAVRSKSSYAFNREGEMAPEGQVFALDGNLRPERK